jgi:hypothetical protein
MCSACSFAQGGANAVANGATYISRKLASSIINMVPTGVSPNGQIQFGDASPNAVGTNPFGTSDSGSTAYKFGYDVSPYLLVPFGGDGSLGEELGDIASVATAGADPVDVALNAARNEAAALRAAKASGDYEGRLPTMTSAAVNRTTRVVVGIGHSGDLGETPASLEGILPNPSLMPWPEWNCGEVSACAAGLAIQQRLQDMVVITVRTRTGEVVEPCDNCKVWVPGS